MKYLIFSFLALSIIACQNANNKNNSNTAESSTDSLMYQIIKYRKVPDNLKDKPDSLQIAYVVASYPQFGPDQKQLNSWINKKIAAAPLAEKASENLETAASQFLQDFEDYRKEYPQSLAGYGWEQNLDVHSQNPDYIAFQHISYGYTGGAHGLETTFYYNWDKSQQKIITLDDILVKDYQTKLNTIAERIFRADENLSSIDPLENYFFEDQQFSLNQNFLIAEKGLQFLYNPYDIKSYAEGTTTLLIPYSDIKDIIKPDGIISKKIN